MSIPTAKEYLLDKERSGMSISEMFIGFAKLHYEAQVRAINSNITVDEEYQYDEDGNEHLIAKIDRDSIKNAYPITNIK